MCKLVQEEAAGWWRLTKTKVGLPVSFDFDTVFWRENKKCVGSKSNYYCNVIVLGTASSELNHYNGEKKRQP